MEYKLFIWSGCIVNLGKYEVELGLHVVCAAVASYLLHAFEHQPRATIVLFPFQLSIFLTG